MFPCKIYILRDGSKVASEKWSKEISLPVLSNMCLSKKCENAELWVQNVEKPGTPNSMWLVMCEVINVFTPVVWRQLYDCRFRALDKRAYLVVIRDNFCKFWKKNIFCDPSSEPSRWDGSDEGSQHMVSLRNKKNNPELSSNTLSYLELCDCHKRKINRNTKDRITVAWYRFSEELAEKSRCKYTYIKYLFSLWRWSCLS